MCDMRVKLFVQEAALSTQHGPREPVLLVHSALSNGAHTRRPDG